MFVRMTGHRDGNADECDPRLVDDSGKKPPLRTEGVPHECARGCVTVPLGRRVVALGDPWLDLLARRHWSCFVAPVVKMMIVVLYRVGG